MPVVSLEALVDVLSKAEFGGAVERDQVVVVEEDELAQAQGAGKRAGFVRDAFHQVAIAAQNVGVVVDDLHVGLVVDGGQMLLRDSQADRHGQALAERASGDLNPGRETVLRMAGRLGVPLAELL